MSISKRIKWIKVVPTLLLVSLATCSLMTVAKSRDSLLTSKADYINQYDIQQSTVINASNWIQDNNYIVRSTFTPSSVTGDYDFFQYYRVVFNGEIDDNSPLIYSVIGETTRTGTKGFETGYFPANTPIEIRSSNLTSPVLRFVLYVKRADGSPLSISDMRSAAFLRVDVVCTQNVVEPVQTTAIPSEWFDTTTQTYETALTVTRPAAYDDSVGTVPVLTPSDGGSPPSWFDQYNPTNKPWFVDILQSLTDWFDIVTVVEGQMKIFWVFGGFVVIGLLLAWLLH